MAHDQERPSGNEIGLPPSPQAWVNALVLHGQSESLILGCTELLEHLTGLQWERQGLLEQRHLLLEQRLALLEQLRIQLRLVETQLSTLPRQLTATTQSIQDDHSSVSRE